MLCTGNISGAMGKRTRFQQEAKAQIVLRVKKEVSECSPGGPDLNTGTEKQIIPKVYVPNYAR